VRLDATAGNDTKRSTRIAQLAHVAGQGTQQDVHEASLSRGFLSVGHRRISFRNRRPRGNIAQAFAERGQRGRKGITLQSIEKIWRKAPRENL